MKRASLAIVLFLSAISVFAADKNLTIVKAGPIGEVANLAEANEVRVVFSEPMVVLGKIPKVFDVPWFHIEPAIKGAFRWSGTTTLIFTPDPKTPLPFATKYDVTVDAAAKAVSGKTLGKAYHFAFTTPTIQLLRTDWYRKGGKYDGAIVIALWFNQPVDAATLGSHLVLRTVKHEFKTPELPARDRLAKLEPEQPAAFDAKVAKAQQAAASDGQPILSFFPTEWDKKHFKPAPEMVIVETKPGVPPDTNLQIFVDDKLSKNQNSVASGHAQTFTIELGPTFFIDKVECLAECGPDYFNPIGFRGIDGVPFVNFRKAVTVTDVTDPAHELPITPSAPKVTGADAMHATQYSLDELGYSLLPAHTYAVRVGGSGPEHVVLDRPDRDSRSGNRLCIVEPRDENERVLRRVFDGDAEVGHLHDRAVGVLGVPLRMRDLVAWLDHGPDDAGADR